jgi:hypothetical protein
MNEIQLRNVQIAKKYLLEFAMACDSLRWPAFAKTNSRRRIGASLSTVF